MDLHSELTKFLKELKDYREMLTNPASGVLKSLLEEKRKSDTVLEMLLPLKSDDQLKKEITEELREKLVRKNGALKGTIIQLTNKQYYGFGLGRSEIWDTAFRSTTDSSTTDSRHTHFALGLGIDATNEAIGKLESGIEIGRIDKSHIVDIEPPKAFIAHEGETRSLTMLKEFLEALGVQYFIAESKASGGRSIEKQVDWTQSKGDFAICLATKGKAINKKTGKYYMGLNVADELGRARQIYGNHIILLVQRGVEVHTNPKEIVHETFTSTNMEKAFIKIAKELTNWGFITAKSIKGASS